MNAAAATRSSSSRTTIAVVVVAVAAVVVEQSRGRSCPRKDRVKRSARSRTSDERRKRANECYVSAAADSRSRCRLSSCVHFPAASLRSYSCCLSVADERRRRFKPDFEQQHKPGTLFPATPGHCGFSCSALAYLRDDRDSHKDLNE